MTVRTISKTTISVVVLIIGFFFFSQYYVKLLSMFGEFAFGNKEYSEESTEASVEAVPDNEEDSDLLVETEIGRAEFFDKINEKLFPHKNNIKDFSAYFPILFYFALIVVLAARTIDAIFDKRVGLTVLAPFLLPLFFTLLITVALFIDIINPLQLWAGFYLLMLICLHSTFKRVILHSELGPRGYQLKLVKQFVLAIKNTISKVISAGIKQSSNPIDEIAILSASALVLLLETIILVSFIVFMANYWQLIFLSAIVN